MQSKWEFSKKGFSPLVRVSVFQQATKSLTLLHKWINGGIHSNTCTRYSEFTNMEKVKRQCQSGHWRASRAKKKACMYDILWCKAKRENFTKSQLVKKGKEKRKARLALGWRWVLNTHYGAPPSEVSSVRVLFRVISHQQLMLLSDLSSGSQGGPPYHISCLCIHVCDWTANHLQKVSESVLSQGFAHGRPSVNAKGRNVFLILRVSELKNLLVLL